MIAPFQVEKLKPEIFKVPVYGSKIFVIPFFDKGKSFLEGLPFSIQEIKGFDKSKNREVISIYQNLSSYLDCQVNIKKRL
jgi:hypothetical protein